MNEQELNLKGYPFLIRLYCVALTVESDSEFGCFFILRVSLVIQSIFSNILQWCERQHSIMLVTAHFVARVSGFESWFNPVLTFLTYLTSLDLGFQMNVMGIIQHLPHSTVSKILTEPSEQGLTHRKNLLFFQFIRERARIWPIQSLSLISLILFFFKCMKTKQLSDTVRP